MLSFAESHCILFSVESICARSKYCDTTVAWENVVRVIAFSFFCVCVCFFFLYPILYQGCATPVPVHGSCVLILSLGYHLCRVSVIFPGPRGLPERADGWIGYTSLPLDVNRCANVFAWRTLHSVLRTGSGSPVTCWRRRSHVLLHVP